MTLHKDILPRVLNLILNSQTTEEADVIKMQGYGLIFTYLILISSNWLGKALLVLNHLLLEVGV